MKAPSKSKIVAYLQAPRPQTTGQKWFTSVLQGKLPFLVIFSVLYGIVFINYIDIITAGGAIYGYHLWLVLMYFLPFAGFSVLNLRNWKLTIALGLLASLMNDVFYGLTKYLIGIPYDLTHYYSNWLIPQNTHLFNLNLGFTVLPVYSWMMALSIYGRIIPIFLLLLSWKKQAKNGASALNEKIEI